MRTLRQFISSSYPELTSELSAQARALDEQYAVRLRAAPHRPKWLWWIFVGWWLTPVLWFARTVVRLICWPVALRRVVADRRLRRERTFWRAIARTSTKGP
jgi:hypothetical protein